MDRVGTRITISLLKILGGGFGTKSKGLKNRYKTPVKLSVYLHLNTTLSYFTSIVSMDLVTGIFGYGNLILKD